MALDIQQKEHEGVTILDLKGRITVGSEASALREKVGALTTGGLKNLVLNLGGVDYIGSTCLGALDMTSTTFCKHAAVVNLPNLARRSIDVLVMTNLATVFEIFTDEQDAVNSFYPDRKLKTFDILSFVQDQKNKGE